MADSHRPLGRSRRGPAVLLAALLLVVLAAGAWYSWHSGWLRSAASRLAPAMDPAPANLPSAAPSAATAAIVAQGNLIQGNMIATNAALADATARLTALQQRLAELNQQALSASGQATRAEALLVAFAARRAIERGQPLGTLETPLRTRFGATQPNAVDQIIAAAQKPVTIGGLSQDFAVLEPRLAGGPANERTWDWMSRQLGSLFIIRHDDMPSPAPEGRLARARAALAGQRVDLAIAEIERLPGKDAATDWLAHARDWIATQRALDQIESAALSTPTAAPIPAPIAPMPTAAAQ
ncbi:hypothetical protein [Novosphingobium sp.]|uniref:hypothetical protein n=1 Tax=Novosphingobium sp. TaxID=1874826 RepID=UPI003D0CAF6C